RVQGEAGGTAKGRFESCSILVFGSCPGRLSSLMLMPGDSGHPLSNSCWAYWPRFTRASHINEYPVRTTVLGLTCQASPTRGPTLSLMGLMIEKGATTRMCWLNGIWSMGFGRHGGGAAALQTGGIVPEAIRNSPVLMSNPLCVPFPTARPT